MRPGVLAAHQYLQAGRPLTPTRTTEGQRVSTADRLDAARWLADRGFGKATEETEIPLCEHPSLDLKGLSREDVEAMLAILERYDASVREQATSGAIYLGVGSAASPGYRQR